MICQKKGHSHSRLKSKSKSRVKTQAERGSKPGNDRQTETQVQDISNQGSMIWDVQGNAGK